MNICFLDLDGVLNSQSYYMSEEFQKGKGSGHSMMDYTLNQIDSNSIDILNKFVKETDCKVVLSSSWRHTAFDNRILYYKGFNGDVIDVTPTLRGSGLVRGNEIHKWICDNKDLLGYHYFNFKTYVIFDDDNDMLLQQAPHFFQTDTYSGITFNTTHRAKRFLKSIKNLND